MNARWLVRVGAFAVGGAVLMLAGSCAGSGTGTNSSAVTASPRAGALRVSGTLASGVEGSCRVLHGDDGKDYSFGSSALDSRFKDGDHVCVTGSPAMGVCMQGTQLEVETMQACRK